MGDGQAGSALGRKSWVHSYTQVWLDTCWFAYDYRDDLQLQSYKRGHNIEKQGSWFDHWKCC